MYNCRLIVCVCERETSLWAHDLKTSYNIICLRKIDFFRDSIDKALANFTLVPDRLLC